MIIKIKDHGLIDTDQICRITDPIPQRDYNHYHGGIASYYFTIVFKNGTDSITVYVQMYDIYGKYPKADSDKIRLIREQELLNRTESLRTNIISAWAGDRLILDYKPDLSFPGIDLRKDGKSILPPQPTDLMQSSSSLLGRAMKK